MARVWFNAACFALVLGSVAAPLLGANSAPDKRSAEEIFYQKNGLVQTGTKRIGPGETLYSLSSDDCKEARYLLALNSPFSASEIAEKVFRSEDYQVQFVLRGKVVDRMDKLGLFASWLWGSLTDRTIFGAPRAWGTTLVAIMTPKSCGAATWNW